MGARARYTPAMGYDLHITRAPEWTESADDPITLAEWLAAVNADPEMRLDGFAEADTPDGATVRYENEGLAVWTAYSAHEEDGNMAWFDYHRGTIVVKNPDEEVIEKMKQLAAQLGAKVLGDEGEEY